MPNPLSKVCSSVVPGELYQTALDDRYLAVDSRVGDRVHFSILDLSNGNLVTEISPAQIDPWYSLVGIHNELLILQYFENKKNPDLVSYKTLNWKSGETSALEEFPSSRNVNTPIWFMEDSEGFSTIKQFLGLELVLGCEYMETMEHVILSYYLKSKNYFNRFLIVLTDGEVSLSIQLDSELKGFAPGSFFTTKNRLIFAHQKNDIYIYEI